MSKTANYSCAHCGAAQAIAIPDKKLVKRKGYTDECKICTECGQTTFVIVYPTGKTETTQISLNY